MIIRILWKEKMVISERNESVAIKSKEFDNIAKAMLQVAQNATDLESDEISAVNWAKEYLGIV